jgi:hypothetical protein
MPKDVLLITNDKVYWVNSYETSETPDRSLWSKSDAQKAMDILKKHGLKHGFVEREDFDNAK